MKKVAWVLAALLVLIGIPLGAALTVTAIAAPGIDEQLQPPAVAGAPLNAAKVPAQYRDHVEAAGKVCQEVTAPAIAAQIEQESGWDPHAASPVGAQGIAQFMPATWPSYASDGNGNGTKSPLEPADAIAAQAKYMCELVAIVRPVAKSSGQPVIELAWAAYNAGPAPVLARGGIPLISETQHYVSILRENTRKFEDVTAAGGQVKANGKWKPPLDAEYMITTSDYGPRPQPCAGCSTFHKGHDFGAPQGAPIYSVCTGVVDFSGQMDGYGNIVFVDCGNGVRTGYAHQSSLGARTGEKVKAGQRIGSAGSTGVGNAPHLHFEVRVDAPTGSGGISGTPLDPKPYLNKKGITW